MRIAVVGATGRIGAKLTENLLAKGHSVKALSRGGPPSMRLSQKAQNRSSAASTRVMVNFPSSSKMLTLRFSWSKPFGRRRIFMGTIPL